LSWFLNAYFFIYIAFPFIRMLLSSRNSYVVFCFQQDFFVFNRIFFFLTVVFSFLNSCFFEQQ